MISRVAIFSHSQLNQEPYSPPPSKRQNNPNDEESCQDCFADLCKVTSKGKIRALLTKNMLRMWRNVGVMLFIFALPVMQVILFCLAIGRDPQGLNLAIVNNEMNNTVSFRLIHFTISLL